jgi:phage shock protein A
MKARAGAMEELEAAGAFDDSMMLGDGQDDIDKQLAQLGTGAAVDDELAKMKAELGQGSAPAAGELGTGTQATPTQEGAA